MAARARLNACPCGFLWRWKMRFLGMGMPELLIILLICLLVFGASKLPEIGKAFGKTIKEFKKSIKDIGTEDENV